MYTYLDVLTNKNFNKKTSNHKKGKVNNLALPVII